MKFKQARSWNGYPQECCHEHYEDTSGECCGDIVPYMGEQDSFGYEVIGLCASHKAQIENDEPGQCDSCGKLTDSLTYSLPLLGMVCIECKYNEY